MKIVICASVVFSDKIIEVTEKLEEYGHIVDIPHVTKLIREHKISLEDYKNHKEKYGDLEYRENLKGEVDMIKRYFNLIKDSESILVLNYDKKDIANYIGGSVLMEMGFAYVQGKKIYLLNPIPKIQYSDEIIAMDPVVINGDLSKIK